MSAEAYINLFREPVRQHRRASKDDGVTAIPHLHEEFFIYLQG